MSRRKQDDEHSDVARIVERGKAQAQRRRERRPIRLNETQDRSERIRSLTREAVRVGQMTPKQRKVLGLPMPTFVLLACVLLALLLVLALWPHAPHYEYQGDEFHGRLAFSDSGKIETRFNIIEQRMSKSQTQTILVGRLELLDFDELPPELSEVATPGIVLRTEGLQNRLSGSFRFRLEGPDGPLAHKIELNGSDSFSSDLQFQVFQGTLLIDDSIRGRFDLRRPRRKPGT
ncbi:MAG: hypothetical protein P9M14_01590 [Candidatus Alcyoniella australis]|nr:hypothetical protein [Candidatus Alcyoniella australis]